MNGREVGNRYLAVTGIATADKLATDYEKLAKNDFVAYNPVSMKILGPGVTFSEVPRIGIAQAVDLDGDGVVDALRDIGGGILDGRTISNVLTDQPEVGYNEIKDVYFRCMSKNVDYPLVVSWRNDDTMDSNRWGQWSYKELNVNIQNHLCDTCDDDVDAKEVSCAFAREFYNKDLSSTAMGFIRRSLEQEQSIYGVDMYPILGKEVEYCITLEAGACGECNLMTGIKTFTLKAETDILALDQSLDLSSYLDGSGNNSYGMKEKLVKMMNNFFEENNVTGHVVVLEQISGSARPCTGFTLLINSCVTVELIGSDDNPLVPCTPEYDPYAGLTVTNQAQCRGCSTGTSFTPNGGVRVVGKGIEINKECDLIENPAAWYHTEVDINTQDDAEYVLFHKVTKQNAVPPKGIGAQYHKLMLEQVVTGTGFDYDQGMADNRGRYGNNKAPRLSKNTLGLNITSIYRNITFQHALPYNLATANSAVSMAKWVSTILIEESDTTTKNAVKAILDPWLASLPVPFKALDLTADTQDSQENIVDGTGTVTTEASDDTGAAGTNN
jgi:hypothetical protein